MKKSLFVVFAAAIALAWSGAEAQVIAGTTPSSLGNCVPFGCHAITRYQQVYAASLFSGPTSINQIQFFYASLEATTNQTPLRTGNYEFRLSETQAPINGFGADLNQNVLLGNTQSVFFNGPLPIATMNLGDVLTFNAPTPFQYTPANGNLLVDIWITGGPILTNTRDVLSTNYLDAEYTYQGLASDFSRAWHATTVLNDNFPPGYQADGHGLVTSFNFAQTVVPEPMTIGLLATGLVGIAGAARRKRQRGLSDD